MQSLILLGLAILTQGPDLRRLPPVETEALSIPDERLPEYSALPPNGAAPLLTPDSTWEDDVAQLPGTQLTALYLAPLGNSAFGIAMFDVHHTWLLGYDDYAPVELTPGFAFHSWSGPTSIDLPERVYDAYLEIAWRPWETEHGGLSLGLTPGYYGDFEHLDAKAFQMTGWIVGNRRLGANWNLVGGVSYVRQLSSNWLPIGGLVWTPSDHFRAEILFPKPRVAWRIRNDERRTDWVYIAGQFGGGAWAVEDSPGTNVLVTYSDLRLLFGWETATIDGREWRTEFGYAFSRDLSVDGNSVFAPGSTFYVQAGFAF